MEKTRLRIALSIFVIILFLFGIYSIYLAQQYPHKITGVYFFLDFLDTGLDHLNLDDVREAFNDSDYMVDFTESPPLDFEGRSLEYKIPDKPDITIVLVEDDADVYFYGEALYEVRFPGGYGDFGKAQDELEEEMGNILSIINLDSFRDQMYFGDYDFAQMEDIINEVIFIAFLSVIIFYSFMFIFRKGELIEKIFMRNLSTLEIIGLLLVFMGSFPTTLMIYWVLIAGTATMCMGLCLVVAVLLIAVGITQLYHKPEMMQTAISDVPEEDEFDLNDKEP